MFRTALILLLLLEPAIVECQSTFFSTAAEESFSTYQMNGDGDLWPSCWADDGNLHAANGDGNGFRHSGLRFDIAVSRISGVPPHLTGTTVATNVGTNWSGRNYNRKPTGMLCVYHSIYLAFQNLNLRNFSDAPAASIARSDNHGVTWAWNKAKPMFADHQFTTIFFLDYGRDSAHDPGKYVYAYGLDHNWRAQSALYLARVPKSKVQKRSAWQFYAGPGPKRTSDIAQKVPVLSDTRLLYRHMLIKKGCPANQHTIAQGGVVYDAPFRRYLFVSWSCATHQFYEAPEPWGPWKLFLSKDFGPFGSPLNRGMYGTSIPSKFISPDGKTLYVQRNICCSGNSYTFALRKILVEPYTPSKPTNAPSPENLAVTGAGANGCGAAAHKLRSDGLGPIEYD